MDSAVTLFLRSATLQISCQLHNQPQHTATGSHHSNTTFNTTKRVLKMLSRVLVSRHVTRPHRKQILGCAGDVLRDRIHDT